MSGAHADLDGTLPIVLGTIPLATNQVPNTAPYIDNVPQQTPVAIQDPSLAPTQPVSPVSPPGGSNGAGWNLYPSIRELNLFLKLNFQSKMFKFHSFCFVLVAAPTYPESAYRANIVDKNESQYMRTAGDQNGFAPRYPVYSAQALPLLPNTQT